jgi:hypothetical protein
MARARPAIGPATGGIIRDLLFRNVLQRWAYVSFFADCAPGEEDATFEKMTRLIATSVPGIVPEAGRAE